MKTIRDQKLFFDLQRANDWERWLIWCNWAAKYPADSVILAGGLDRIETKKGGVYFYDRGRNDKNNSFVVRRGGR